MSSTDGMTFGERLQAIREKMDWSLRRLAAESGVSPSYMSQLETGRREDVSAAKLAVLARVLGVSMDVLWNGDGKSGDVSVSPYIAGRIAVLRLIRDQCARGLAIYEKEAAKHDD